MPRQFPPQQPPPVMKVLVRYGKVGPMRFASHRDLARGFERGLRRAEIPMAYSSGFSPHPRVSYVNPAPTGVASQAELLVLGLRERIDVDDVRSRLDAVMPEGVPVLEAMVDGDVRPEASLWEIDLSGIDKEVVERAVGEFDLVERVEVSRETKNGLRTFDVKPAVVELRTGKALSVIIRHTEPLVRPGDVMEALSQLVPEAPTSALVTRLAQGPVSSLSAQCVS